MRPGEFDPGYKVPAADLNLLPAGILAYAQVTANQTGITTIADLTGLAVTITTPVGRWIRITGHAGALRQNTSQGTIVGTFREGTTILGRWTTATVVAGGFGPGQGSHVVQGDGASHTYKLSLQTSAGTTDLLADTGGSQGPAYILAEDIGAVV
jgi:hypothetical protein